MASDSSQFWRGRDREPPALGNTRPRHRSESRRLSDQQRPPLLVGDKVRVFSRSTQEWVDGELVDFMEGNLIRVEYYAGDCWCGKTLHLHSQNLVYPIHSSEFEVDPGVNFTDEHEVRSALQHVWIQVQHEGWLQIDMALKHQGGLAMYQNNSFYTPQPLVGPCNISHHGPDNEDVLIKIYILDAEHHHYNHWDKYTLVGYMHGKVKHDSVTIQKSNAYFLGIMLHRDLNEDQLWKLPPEEIELLEARSLVSSEVTLGGYGARSEVPGEQRARDAHYLLSMATADMAGNNKLLNYLTTHPVKGPHCEEGGPIKFCTYRSLGLGQHFTKENMVLYLAKYGFGQPIESDWFEPYEEAAKQTRHGVLILQLSTEYLRSMACRNELGKLDQERLCLYVGGTVVPWGQLKEDSELLMEALGRACQVDIKLGPVERMGCVCQELLGFNTDWYYLERVLTTLAVNCGRERSDPHTCLLFNDLVYHFNRRVYGEHHGYTSVALSCLACCRGAIGEYEKMKEMQQKALEMHEESPWIDLFMHEENHWITRRAGGLQQHPYANVVLMHHLCSLAQAHAFLGDYQSVKKIAYRTCQVHCPKYAAYYRGRILKQLSDAHGFLGEVQRKEHVLHVAVKLLERHLKEFKEWVAKWQCDGMYIGLVAHFCSVHVLLGNAHGELRRPAQKKELLLKAIEMIENYLGENHFSVGNILGNLAQVCRDLGEFTREKEVLERMLRIYSSHYGDVHVMTTRVKRVLDGEQDIIWPDEDDVISPGWWVIAKWWLPCPPSEIF